MIRSDNDSRKYHYLKLQNKLDILVISDSKATKEAVCLTVAAGSYQEKISGIAHLVEHLLFLGSSKYPKENAYDEIIKAGFGKHNANTLATMTTYYFDCVPSCFAKTLDVFSQCFISPLFVEDRTLKEISILDEEFQTDRSDEDSRFDRGISQFIRYSHPEHRYAAGDLRLKDIININELCIEFYKKYYSANLMKVVILGTESLAELTVMCQKTFSSLRNVNASINLCYGQMFHNNVAGHIFSNDNVYKQRISWEYVTIKENDQINFFVGHLIVEGGNQFLNDHLEIEHLGLALQEQPDYSLIRVDIVYNENNWKHHRIVPVMLRRYLEFVCGVSYETIEELYNQYRNKKLLDWKYYVDGEADVTVESLCRKWIFFRNGEESGNQYRELLSRQYLLPIYTAQQHKYIKSYIKRILNGTESIFTFAKYVDTNKIVDNIKIEEPYGVEYISLPNWQSQLCHNLSATNLSATNLSIGLFQHLSKWIINFPSPQGCNIYQNKSPEYLYHYPSQKSQRLADGTEIYWKHNLRFDTPKICLIFLISFPFKLNIQDIIIKNVVLRCLLLNLKNHLSKMRYAGYNISIISSSGGYRVIISGYIEKFVLVVTTIMKKVWLIIRNLNNISSCLIEEGIQIYKRILHHQKNGGGDMLNDLSRNILQSKKFIGYFGNDLLLEVLDSISISEVQSYKMLTDNVKLYGIINGNVNSDLASQIGEILNELRLKSEYHAYEQIKKNNNNIFKFASDNEKLYNKGSCCRLSIKFGYLMRSSNVNMKIRALLRILTSLLDQEFFHVLRTIEQLSYQSNCSICEYGIDEDNQYTTCDFVTISHQVDSEFLYKRTLNFIKDFRAYLTNLSNQYIKTLVKSYLYEINTISDTLEEDTMNHYRSILKGIHSQTHSITSDYFNNFDDFGDFGDFGDFILEIDRTVLLDFYDNNFILSEGNYWVVMI